MSWGRSEEPSEDHITPEDLEELELAEAWVQRLVQLEEEEEDHLVATALRYAPQDKVAAIERAAGVESHGAAAPGSA